MKDFWNLRYGQTEYAYGSQPNEYLKTVLSGIKHEGKVLFAAEGEGRNAVFAAGLGFQVTALDYSETGKAKALQLAQQAKVTIDYQIADLIGVDLINESFDILVLIYAHFPPQWRKEIHLKLQKAIKKGGLVIIEGFSKNHLEVSKNNKLPSGPRDIDLLYNDKIIQEDFLGFEVLKLSEEIVELDEGEFHQGRSSVIRFLGRKVS